MKNISAAHGNFHTKEENTNFVVKKDAMDSANQESTKNRVKLMKALLNIQNKAQLVKSKIKHSKFTKHGFGPNGK